MNVIGTRPSSAQPRLSPCQPGSFLSHQDPVPRIGNLEPDVDQMEPGWMMESPILLGQEEGFSTVDMTDTFVQYKMPKAIPIFIFVSHYQSKAKPISQSGKKRNWRKKSHLNVNK